MTDPDAPPPPEPPSRRATPLRQRTAAEEDAANMLLASGIDPTDRSAIEALLAEPADAPAMRAYTIPQVCRMYGISVTTFGRRRKLGQTPTVIDLYGSPRILHTTLVAFDARLIADEKAGKPPVFQPLRLVAKKGG